MELPRVLIEEWPEESGWLAQLPELAAECAEAWKLALESPVETPHSLVVPAGDMVLKLNAPGHFEADHEADALERWAGAGAVRLLGRDDQRRALLLERCVPGTPLAEAGADQIAVACDLLARVTVEAEEPFRRLADEADGWVDDLSRREVPAHLLDYSLDVLRTVDRSAHFIVNQDLHAWNILAAEREPWLMIDPKPLIGERELDAVGLLRNAAKPGRWLDALVALGLDRERLRGWGVAHALAWDNLDAAERIFRAR